MFKNGLLILAIVSLFPGYSFAGSDINTANSTSSILAKIEFHDPTKVFTDKDTQKELENKTKDPNSYDPTNENNY